MFVEVEDVNGNAGYGMINIAVYDTTALVNIFDLEDYTLYAVWMGGPARRPALVRGGRQLRAGCRDHLRHHRETGIAGCREFDRRWIIQSTDTSGNMSSDTALQRITVVDDIAPTVFFDNAPKT